MAKINKNKISSKKNDKKSRKISNKNISAYNLVRSLVSKQYPSLTNEKLNQIYRDKKDELKKLSKLQLLKLIKSPKFAKIAKSGKKQTKKKLPKKITTPKKQDKKQKTKRINFYPKIRKIITEYFRKELKRIANKEEVKKIYYNVIADYEYDKILDAYNNNALEGIVYNICNSLFPTLTDYFHLESVIWYSFANLVVELESFNANDLITFDISSIALIDNSLKTEQLIFKTEYVDRIYFSKWFNKNIYIPFSRKIRDLYKLWISLPIFDLNKTKKEDRFELEYFVTYKEKDVQKKLQEIKIAEEITPIPEITKEKAKSKKELAEEIKLKEIEKEIEETKLKTEKASIVTNLLKQGKSMEEINLFIKNLGL